MLQAPQPIIPPIPPKPTLVQPTIRLLPLHPIQDIALQNIPQPDKPNIPQEVTIPKSILPYVNIGQYSVEALPVLSQLYTYLLDDSEWLFTKEVILRKYLQTKTKLFGEETKKGNYFMSGSSQRTLMDLQTSERLDILTEYFKYLNEKNSVATKIVKQIVDGYWELQALMLRNDLIETNFDISKHIKELKLEAERLDAQLKAQKLYIRKVVEIESNFSEIQAIIANDISNHIRMQSEKLQNASIQAASEALIGEISMLTGKYVASEAQLQALELESRLLQNNLKLLASMLYEATKSGELALANINTARWSSELEKQKVNLAKLDAYKSQIRAAKTELEAKVLEVETQLITLLGNLNKTKVQYASAYDLYGVAKEKLAVAIRKAMAGVELEDAKLDELIARFSETVSDYKLDYMESEVDLKQQASRYETDIQTRYITGLKKFHGELDAEVAHFEGAIRASAADRIAAIEIGSKITANLIHQLRK